MDIASLVSNERPAQDERKAAQEADRQRPPQPPPPSASSTLPPTPAGLFGPPSQQTPLYPPSAGSPPRAAQSVGLTPLQTPSHAPGPGQYPFPQQTSQSPVYPPGQQYRPFESSAAGTPGQRPPSHGYPFAQPSPSQPPPPGGHVQYGHANSSQSPTPSSHHSQTPGSMRQSPMSVMAHPPNQPPPQYQQLQHSQPSTPLGPPPLNYQRTSNLSDVHSPFHQRTYSGASNGAPSGSPAHHHPSIGNLVESPNAYYRPSPHLRKTSEYLSHVDRERSVSVSPKTKVPPRPPSLGSRQSSQLETISNRSSVQANIMPAGSQHHVMQPQHSGLAAPGFASLPNPSGEAPQQGRPLSSSSSSGAANPMGAISNLPSSLSQPGNQTLPSTIQHQSQKMGMSHLLTPASEVPPQVNGMSVPPPDVSQREQQQPNATKPTPPQRKMGDERLSQQEQAPVKSEYSDASAYHTHEAAPLSQPEQKQALPPTANISSVDNRPPLKRAADTDKSLEPPAKQQKKQKYREPPIWATYSQHNPRYHQQKIQNGVTATSSKTNGIPMQQQQPQQQIPPQPQPNGQPRIDDPENQPPWLQKPPLDGDLIHMRRVLGDKWEKTFRWNTPYPDMLREVQDWLCKCLSQLGEVGTNPREGTIEIEAKVGTLLQQTRNGLDRCQLPVKSMTVVNPDENRNFQFESQMTLAEHKAMNEFLNATIQSTYEKGRAQMDYKHLYETDSFYTLSKLGHDLLPDPIKKHLRRNPRLRITRETKPPHRVLARIIKVPIDNLHIFNPHWKYDCRISINLEVNLDRPDLDPESLIEPPPSDPTKAAQVKEVDRIKDRLSYKHLAYSIDLTKVEREGLGATYELELEMDSNLLRQQMQLMLDKKDNAFGDVISGFLDNATFLMRQSPVSQ